MTPEEKRLWRKALELERRINQLAQFGVQPVGVPGVWDLVFADEFNGPTIDTVQWLNEDHLYKNGVGTLPANAVLSGGHLALTLTNPQALTGDSSTFEGGLGSWVGSGCTVARSTAQAHSGIASMALTATAAGNATANPGVLGSMRVVPGQQVFASAWMRAATNGRTCRLQFDFFTGQGTGYLSTINGGNVVDTTTGWTNMSDAGLVSAPATANWVFINVAAIGVGAAGEVHYADDVTFSSVWGAELSTTNYLLPVNAFAEARVYMPGSGADVMYNWPAWWVSGPSWPAAGEHDVAEVAGWAGGNGSMTINYHSPSGAHAEGAPAGTWSNGFHVFGLYRKTSSADVYWDGVKVATYSTDDNGQPENLICTLGGTAGVNSLYGAGSQVLFDYVRAWVPA